MKGNGDRRWIWFTVRLMIVLVILAVIARKLDFAGMRTALSGAAPGPVLLAVLLFVANRFITALKWDLLLRRNGIRAGLMKLTRIMFESTFLGMAIPSGLGVDIARLAQISMARHNLTSSASSVLADRALAVLTLALMSVAAACLCGRSIEDGTVLAVVIVMGALVTVAILLLMSSLSLSLYALLHRAACALLRKIGLLHTEPGAGRAGMVMRKVTEIHESLAGILKDPAALAMVLGINIVVQLVRIAQVHLLFIAIGEPVPVLLNIAFVPMILMIKLFPISPYMGIGVQEGAFVYFFSRAGISPEVALSASILMHMVVIIGIIPGALLFFSGRRPGAGR